MRLVIIIYTRCTLRNAEPVKTPRVGILQRFQAMGYPVARESFALRTDDLIVQWQAAH